MSLAAEAITTDCPALQPASLHMDWGSGHFSILMTTSTQGQGGGDHLQVGPGGGRGEAGDSLHRV
jgi:hypothetical protein